MPDREGERSWDASFQIAERAQNPTQKVAKQAAIWIFHQFCLHPKENPLSIEKLFQKNLETFRLLSEREMEILRKVHNRFPEHGYWE